MLRTTPRSSVTYRIGGSHFEASRFPTDPRRCTYRIAGDLKKIIWVSDHAWLDAQEVMGKQMAAAAMALVFDKHAKGEVSSAGGYLRGMTEKAGAGELHLERSFYGRLSGQAA